MGLRLLLDGQEELELRRKVVLGVEPVREVDPPDPAVGVDLDAEGFDVVGSVGAPGEVGEVELDLVPALVETHGHGTDEGLDPRGGLVVGGTEATADVLVIQNLDLEGEVLLEVLDDHDEEGELDPEGPLGISGA